MRATRKRRNIRSGPFGTGTEVIILASMEERNSTTAGREKSKPMPTLSGLVVRAGEKRKTLSDTKTFMGGGWEKGVR